MANTVSVSAVPFNPNTQSFQSTPNTSMGTVNLNSTPQSNVPTAAQNLAAFQATQPKTPATTNIPVSNLGTQAIQIPYQQPTQVKPTSNAPQNSLQSQTIATPVADLNNNISSSIANLYSGLSGQATDSINAQNSATILAEKQNQQNLANQVLQKQAELNQDSVSLAAGLQNIEDQAIPMQFITGQQASVASRANIARGFKVAEIEMLNAQSQAALGNIALAQETAQAAVDAKYAPIKEQISILQAQQQAIQPLLSAEEKKVAAQQSALAETQKQLLASKQTQEKTFLDMVLKAPTDYGATPDMVNNAIKTYNQTGDIFQATQALMGYGGSEINSAYATSNSARNTAYNTSVDMTIENGYDLNAFKQGIAGVESAGSGGYSAIGPATKSGDKAYGKYQVMGANIPSWTKQALGYSMTADQFLKSPSAQEAVFENQSLTNYAKYGNWDDVASVWFSGRPLTGNTSSDGYNTVPQYVAKVRTQMGVSAQPTTLSQVTNPSVVTWANFLNSGGDIKEVPKSLQTQALAYKQQNVVNNPQTQNIVEKINQIDNIINNPALSSVVGPNIFGRGVFSSVATGAATGGTAGAIGGSFIAPLLGTAIGAVGGAILGGATGYATTDQFSGQAQNFIADVEQLTSKETLDTLINAKAKGATFGALSIPELALLQQSATKINKWAIHVDNDPNKPVIGYNTDEQSFLKELEQVKKLAQKGIAQSGGNILGGTIGQTYATSLIQSQNATTAVSALNYGFK